MPPCHGQVQTLTATISVEQRFLSPENATRLWDHSTDPPGAAPQLRAQVSGWRSGGCRGGPGLGCVVLTPPLSTLAAGRHDLLRCAGGRGSPAGLQVRRPRHARRMLEQSQRCRPRPRPWPRPRCRGEPEPDTSRLVLCSTITWGSSGWEPGNRGIKRLQCAGAAGTTSTRLSVSLLCGISPPSPPPVVRDGRVGWQSRGLAVCPDGTGCSQPLVSG